MLQNALQKLGFTDKEQIIYLTILKDGRATPARLANQSNLNRTTVYSVAQSLLLKGVINEDATAPTLTYIATSPDELSNLIDQEKRQLKQKAALVDEIIAELDKVEREQGVAAPKLGYIRESEIERWLYKRSKVWDESMKQYDSIWWGFQSTSFVTVFQEWITWYWREGRDNKKMALQMFTNDDEAEKQIAAQGITDRKMQYWDKSQIKETTWVLGDYLVIIATDQKPYYAVEIKNPSLCATMREMFKLLWQ